MLEVETGQSPAMGPDAFDYVLPPELIAQHPPERRRDARMLVLGRHGQALVHTRVGALADMLPANALIVVNASKVVPARLYLERRGDGRVFELLVTAPAVDQGPGTTLAAWVRNAKRLSVGDVLGVDGLTLRVLGADPIDPRARQFVVEVGDVLETCRRVGAVPLPPYIRRETGPTSKDADRYQTVFGSSLGSVAAPTAGLHFDADLLEQLDVAKVTLHVGPGTFLPLEAQDVRDHRVGRERIDVSGEDAALIEQARAQGRPIVAVGTTVTRTLETLGQGGRPILSGATQTELVITPGFRFSVVTHLLTNFHLPRSSLLMLVCTFAGRERVLAGYAAAIAEGYRFYSYGDCMLCERE